MPVNTATPPLGTNLGPGSWTPRRDIPDLSHDGKPVFRPMRHATDFRVMKGEADPRGYTVLGLDKQVAGTVVDIWIDESEHSAKFLEIRLDPALARTRGEDTAPTNPVQPKQEPEVVGIIVTETLIDTPRGTADIVEIDPVVALRHGTHDDESYGSDVAPAGSIMIPMEFAAVNEIARTVRTATITAAQFAGVPGRKYDTILTAMEENRLRGYYGGGYLWATSARTEPLL